MGGYFSKTPINFNKNIKYDMIINPEPCYDKNIKNWNSSKRKCNKKEIKIFKNYLKNHLYNYINLYYSNGGFSELSPYSHIQKLKKKDIKKVKYIDNKFIVSVSTKLVNKKKYENEILYLEKFINELKEEINHYGTSGPAYIIRKGKSVEMDFGIKIDKIINISN